MSNRDHFSTGRDSGFGRPNLLDLALPARDDDELEDEIPTTTVVHRAASDSPSPKPAPRPSRDDEPDGDESPTEIFKSAPFQPLPPGPPSPETACADDYTDSSEPSTVVTQQRPKRGEPRPNLEFLKPVDGEQVDVPTRIGPELSTFGQLAAKIEAAGGTIILPPEFLPAQPDSNQLGPVGDGSTAPLEFDLVALSNLARVTVAERDDEAPTWVTSVKPVAPVLSPTPPPQQDLSPETVGVCVAAKAVTAAPAAPVSPTSVTPALGALKKKRSKDDSPESPKESFVPMPMTSLPMEGRRKEEKKEDGRKSESSTGSANDAPALSSALRPSTPDASKASSPSKSSGILPFLFAEPPQKPSLLHPTLPPSHPPSESSQAPTRQIRKNGKAKEGPATNNIHKNPHRETRNDSAVAPPKQIGPYEIQDVLGRGGMGVVYRGYQRSTDRTVAIKMILAGQFASTAEVERFRSEAIAVARLHHPHLTAIFEIGEHEGLPFYAMEYLEGGSLAERLGHGPIQPRLAACLVQQLAWAMDYAHKQNIIHRDLKPANVLLKGPANAPIDQMTPKITDFGLAKNLSESHARTATGDIIGTPSYMAPEQADGRPHQVGPFTDVYSLGAILYEVLTGKVVFEGENAAETIVKVTTEEPVPPRKINANIPLDLETICLKCLQKDKTKRYMTANLLAEDLGRFLEGEPISARPRSFLFRTWKWAKKRPALAFGLAVFLIAMFTALGWMTVAWKHANLKADSLATARGAEAKARLTAERSLAEAYLDRGLNLAERGDVRRGLHWLLRGLEIAEKSDESQALAKLLRTNLAGWSQYVFSREIPLPHKDQVVAVAYRPDGQLVATAGRDAKVRLWNAGTGQPHGVALDHDFPVSQVAFSTDGKTLITSGGKDDVGELRVWRESGSGQYLLAGSPVVHQGCVTHLAIRPDGKGFATASTDGFAFLWEWTSPTASPTLKARLKHADVVTRVAFSHHGRILVSASRDGILERWNASNGIKLGPPLQIEGPVHSLDISGDDKFLIAGGGKKRGEAKVWTLTTGESVGDVSLTGAVQAVAFAPGNVSFATASQIEAGAGEVRLWKIEDKIVPLNQRLAHPKTPGAVAFSRDGRLILTGCEDGCSRLWLAATGQLIGTPLRHEGPVPQVAFSPLGDSALTASAGGNQFAAARLWRFPATLASGLHLDHPGAVPAILAHPRQHALLTSCADGAVRWWDLDKGELRKTLVHHKTPAQHLLPLRDGQSFLTSAKDGSLYRCQLDSGQILARFPKAGEELFTLSACPDQQGVLASQWQARKWLRIGESKVEQWSHQELNILQHIYSPDGQHVVLALGSPGSNLAQTWFCDPNTLEKKQMLQSDGAFNALAFSPDGKTLAGGGDDRLVQCFDALTGKSQGFPLAHEHPIHALAFSSDGSILATGARDGSARLWHVATGKPLSPPLRHQAKINSIVFDPSKKQLLCASDDGQVVGWKIPQPIQGSVEHLRCWVEVLTGMKMNEEGAILALDPALYQIRQTRLRELGTPRE